jgi:hypothetical protein
MPRIVVAIGTMTFALMVAALLFPGTGWAQGGTPCSGRASVVNGQVVVQDLTPAIGLDSQCEVLAMPGGLFVQDGGTTTAIDGIDGKHESIGHSGHT